jgi:uncharacterized protein YggE
MDTNATSNKRFSLSLDYRFVIILLLIVIATMLVIWKPWSPAVKDENRVIEVTGEATIKAEPNEYLFMPSYEFRNANKDTALSELTKKSDEVVGKLKELGIADSKIKTNSSGLNYYPYYYDEMAKTNNYTLQLTVTVDNRELAQKVQDYLITTQPTGAISPQATFSEDKRKELESQARDQATKDARAKAEQSGKNLGFKVGSVKSVNDGAGFGGIEPYYNRGMALDTAVVPEQQLAVQPGENELRYSVTVAYYLR